MKQIKRGVSKAIAGTFSEIVTESEALLSG
jgi:hypothetical protein